MKNDGDDEDNGGENSVTQVTVKEEDGCGTTICQVTLRWCRFQPKTLPLSWQCRKGNKHIFNSTCTRRDFNLKNWPFFFFFLEGAWDVGEKMAVWTSVMESDNLMIMVRQQMLCKNGSLDTHTHTHEKQITPLPITTLTTTTNWETK